MTIGGSGASFQSVTVDDGSSNGIILSNLTGGQVSVTGSGSTNASGGTLHTDNSAIVLTNAANVSLSNIQVTNVDNGVDAVAVTNSNTAAMTTTFTNIDVEDGDDAFHVGATGSGAFTLEINDSSITGVSGQALDLTADTSANNVTVGIDNMTSGQGLAVVTDDAVAFVMTVSDSTISNNATLSLNGSGTSNMLVENSVFDAASGVAFDLNFGSATHNAGVTIRNNTGTGFRSGDDTAFAINANGTNADVDFLFDNNVVQGDSGTDEAFTSVVNGGATLNANVVNNTFTNFGAADEFYMNSDGSNTRINLNLDNNTATGGGVYHLETTNRGGNFNFAVQDRDNTDSNNAGTVNFDPLIGDFEDITGPVPEPTAP